MVVRITDGGAGSTITMTLGTPSATTVAAATAAAMIWTPAASSTDAGANATLTTAATETGAADPNF